MANTINPTVPANQDDELEQALNNLGSPKPLETSDPPVQPVVEPTPTPTPPPAPKLEPVKPSAAPIPPADLATVKASALSALKPIIKSVDLPPDEKFYTYMMMIQATDDSSLVPPAFEAAGAIKSESQRAQALLDLIKEIEFLSRA